MTKKTHIYWYCQILGWSFYIVANSIYLGLSTQTSGKDFLLYFFMFFAGIGISHLYRALVIRRDILTVRIPTQLVFMVFFSFVKGVLFFLIIVALAEGLDLGFGRLTVVNVLTDYVINFTGVFFLWNVIYFGFQYFQNYKRAEIDALRYLAASRESELSNLKAQLNPHFIFNCMNSIRALVDENPLNAKAAITRLSNILRNTLLMDKNKEIVLKEEINLVKDYLDLEKIRYEERLNYEFKIENEVNSCLIPPFIIQSQVENAIKHGISKLPGPGLIKVEAATTGDQLRIKVSNTGKLNSQKPLTGVGLKNSIHRLDLLYGQAGSIQIHENNDWVVVEIALPLRK